MPVNLAITMFHGFATEYARHWSWSWYKPVPDDLAINIFHGFAIEYAPHWTWIRTIKLLKFSGLGFCLFRSIKIAIDEVFYDTHIKKT